MQRPFWIFLCLFLSSAFSGKRQDSAIHGWSGSLQPQKFISFSGYRWALRNSLTKQGPGPNYFNDRNVWLDSKGRLHLLIQKDTLTGKWECAELVSTQDFGFGTYEFTVEGLIDQLDKNVDLGLFNYSGHDTFDELDIEFCRWGNPRNPNLSYTVWPAEKPYQKFFYTREFKLTGPQSRHRFQWSRDSVVFSSMEILPSGSRLIEKTTCTSPPHSISQLKMPVHINLWLFEGHAPDDQQRIEVVLTGFHFDPE